MPIAHVRGANLNYEVLGTRGAWLALSPGGRRALEHVKPLAQRMADAGYRVLIHDRRNCGLSDIVIGGDASEYEIWADDLHALLARLDALPAIVGGSSSGCRLSLLFALKYPHAVRALLLWRVTGGSFAAARLTENYYGKYIDAARAGGMAAVCALDHFKERRLFGGLQGDPRGKSRGKRGAVDRFSRRRREIGRASCRERVYVLV